MEQREEYKGLWFDERTAQPVRDAILRAFNRRKLGERVRIFYGDTETGESRLEEFDIMGYIGRSTGEKKIPLLVNNSRSYGGGALLDHCIVKIMTTAGRTLYEHPNFHLPPLNVSELAKHTAPGLPVAVLKGNEVHARFARQSQAYRYVEFMHGARMVK